MRSANGQSSSASTKSAVIVPTYHDGRRLQLCLDALERQTMPDDAFEIIVANNDPADTLSEVALPANARVINVEKAGSYAARNAAVEATSADTLVFTDSDCVPEPQWLEAGLSALEEDGGRVTGPITIFRDEGASRTAYEYEFHTAFRIREYVQEGRATTANLFVRRSDFERVGAFDEDLLSGGDFEWNNRASKMGVAIAYDEAVTIGHPARRSIGALFAKRRRVARAEAEFRFDPFFARAKYLLKPPVGRMPTDRGTPTRFTRAKLFAVQWMMNAYTLLEWTLARQGMVHQVRQ